MAGRVEGKKAFVTGAAQGLGACFARMLAEEGAKVALTDINGAGAQEQADAINEKHPGAAIAIEHDVTQKAQWETALEEAAGFMGGISVLVNNAGIASLGSIETETFENWRRVNEINQDSIFVGTHLAMPYLKDNQPGSIINLSSVSGLIADGNFLSYNATKAAVWMMTKSIALHCARSGYEIRCNSVHPVFIRTPILDPMLGVVGEERLVKQIPMKRIGEPEDVGYCVLYLASDESKFVTGSEFKIDGGITAQ